jgi:hypothetical protein
LGLGWLIFQPTAVRGDDISGELLVTVTKNSLSIGKAWPW